MRENLWQWQLSLLTMLFVRLCTTAGGKAIWYARVSPGPPPLLPICGGGRLPARKVARQCLRDAACQGETAPWELAMHNCCWPGRQDNPPPWHHHRRICNKASHAWDGRSDITDFFQSGITEHRKYLILPFVRAKMFHTRYSPSELARFA